MSDNNRIDKLEEITSALSGDLSQIKHDMTAIRRELVGSKDGMTEGALPRLNRHIATIYDRVDRLEANGFTQVERERILHFVRMFEGWKLVIGAVVFVAPLIALVLTIIISN